MLKNINVKVAKLYYLHWTMCPQMCELPCGSMINELVQQLIEVNFSSPNEVLKEEAVSGGHFEKIPLVLPLDGQRAHIGWSYPCYMQEYFCPN